jgi:hypothetical protein
MFSLDATIDNYQSFSATAGFPGTISPSVVRLLNGARESDLPPSAVCIDCPHPAKLPDLSSSWRTDDQNTVRGRQSPCPLVEDQEKLDWDVGRIFEQISTVGRFVRKSSKRHPDRQAGNFAGLELVGADRYIGRFSKRQLLFGVGSPKEILEPFLGKRRFFRIWFGLHKGIIIRAKRCARRTRMLRAGSANQTDQNDREKRAFHRVEFECPFPHGSKPSHNGGPTIKDECRILHSLRRRRYLGESFLLFKADLVSVSQNVS